MAKPLFSRSARKHIRLKKALIRREIFDTAKRQELIEKLLGRFLQKPKEEPTPLIDAEERPKKISQKKIELVRIIKEK